MIRSLFSYPCKMSVKAILTTLPYKIKADVENELWKKYIAKCIRLLTENSAGMVKKGQFITAEYEDLIKPKSCKEYREGEITEKIKSKLR